MAAPNVVSGNAPLKGSHIGFVVTATAPTWSAVSANTTAEQDLTVTGVAVGDFVAVNKPTAQAGLGIVGVRAKSANTVGVTFSNNTGSSITPTATESFTVWVVKGAQSLTKAEGYPSPF